MTVTLHDGLEEIGVYAFGQCHSIAKVNIIVPGVLSFLTPVNNAHCANYNLNEAELDDDDHSEFSYMS